MELSRNKIILLIISGIIGFFIVIILVIMMFSSKNTNYGGKNLNGDFSVWIVGEKPVNLENFVDGFSKFSKVKGNVSIKNFSNYEDYSLALTYALASGDAPDVFVLNNNEKNSLFENQVLGISPKVFSPDFFRREYKTFFTEQLISKTENNKDFVIGLPVGYETLGIFYNKRFVNSSDLKSFSSLNSAVSRIKNKNPNILPIAIGNGTTLDFSEDIATQLIVSQSGERSIGNLSKKSIQVGLGNYLLFGDIQAENAYNSRYNELKKADKTAVDLFSDGVAMVVGYPRLINKIFEKGFSSSLLLATPFPNDSKNGATLVNYNYFVINKDSPNISTAENFISYLSSKEGVEKYFETFPYYLPAIEAFETELFDKKIHPKFNVKLKDFYNESSNYTSFDKGIKYIYDKNLRNILDYQTDAIDEFLNFQKSLNCKTSKIVSQDNFEKNCD